MPQRLIEVASVMDVFEIPVFLMSVEPPAMVRYVKINTAHQRETGLTHEQISLRTPQQIFSPRTAKTVMRNYKMCIETQETYSYTELLDLPRGSSWWRTMLSPIVLEDKVIGIVGFSQNIDAEKKTEADLASAIQQLSQSNARLEVMTSTLAHDLRGPMRQAKVIMELIREGFEDACDKKLQLIESGGAVIEKALDLIDGRLDQVRTADTINVRSVEIDLARWGGNVSALLDPLHRLQISFPEMTVRCELFMLDIALRNLVDNAVKHARTRVDVEVESRGDLLVFTVLDDGEGFQDPAFKAGEALPNKPGSETADTGLGLEATRRLIEGRGGKIWVDARAEPGKGAAISFEVNGLVISTAQTSQLLEAHG
ncbi:MAG: ATP-binding protein [Pseudomonadota bacterium]